MSEMFDNYPQPKDYIPNNRPCHCKHFRLDMMTGETSEHSFEVPFNVEEACTDFFVMYRLGLDTIIVKNSTALTVLEDKHGCSIISCTLSPEETSLFRNTLLDTVVQLKFYMIDGGISFSDIYRVKVIDSLLSPTPVPPEPGVIAGLGYTED